VACGLRWPKALKGHAMLEVPPPAEVFDGHSIALVGYDDDSKKPGGGTFQFRNSFGPGWGAAGYGVMSYAYVRAYANDALWLRLGPPGSELPAERFEAEVMTVLAAQKCGTSSQGTAPWGGPLWSRGEHLFCRAAQGGFVELGFEVKKAGRYRVRVLATAAPDYGILRASVDGMKPAGDFDLYAGRVCPSGPLELGTHTLAAGKHRVRFTAAGKNAVSTNTFLGLDAVDLLTAR
jgi:hypothetical protein